MKCLMYVFSTLNFYLDISTRSAALDIVNVPSFDEDGTSLISSEMIAEDVVCIVMPKTSDSRRYSSEEVMLCKNEASLKVDNKRTHFSYEVSIICTL
jgi:hypothetical protein